jgi:hypothetical protein
MTAVVLYSSIPGVGHHGACPFGTRSSSTRSFLRSASLPGGTPNTTIAGHPMQIRASLQTKIQPELCKCNSLID